MPQYTKVVALTTKPRFVDTSRHHAGQPLAPEIGQRGHMEESDAAGAEAKGDVLRLTSHTALSVEIAVAKAKQGRSSGQENGSSVASSQEGKGKKKKKGQWAFTSKEGKEAAEEPSAVASADEEAS